MLALAAALAVITLGPAANGTAVSVRAGDGVVVRLPGNATTGYRWSVTRTTPALHIVGAAYVAPHAGVVGSGGTYVFRFVARRGTGRLALAYRRPWETAPPLRTYAVTVHVR